MKNKSPKTLLLFVIFSAALASACLSNANPESKSATAMGSIETFMPAHVRIVFRRSCEMCHGPDGRGITGVAPDIQRAQPRSSAAWEQYLRDPHNTHPDATTSPPVWLNEEEVKAVAEFLARLHPSGQPPIETPAAR